MLTIQEAILEAVAILLDEGGDLFTILNDRFNLDRGMVERYLRNKKDRDEANRRQWEV